MADDTPNLPAVDDAIEGEIVPPWHVTADRIDFRPGELHTLFCPLCRRGYVEYLLSQAQPPPPPDHHADPSIRSRMLLSELYGMRVVRPSALTLLTGI